jgi:hypothetical protein
MAAIVIRQLSRSRARPDGRLDNFAAGGGRSVLAVKAEPLRGRAEEARALTAPRGPAPLGLPLPPRRFPSRDFARIPTASRTPAADKDPP